MYTKFIKVVCIMKIQETAYAKINLGLDILGKRSDGYHEVSMVMQSVGLCDTVTAEEAAGGIKVVTNISGLSCGADNLAYKATAILADKFHITPNVRVTLEKKIFMAAGLAGGSSDGAATLRALNRLWQLHLTAAQLEEIAAELGSDVPFCICGGTALAKGRGELIEPLPDMPPAHVVLAKPRNMEVSTAWVYKNYNKGRVVAAPCIRNIIARLPSGGQAITPYMGNVLEMVTIPAHPVIAAMKAAALGAGAYYAMMSGSGPTVFALCADEAAAKSTAAALAQFDAETAVTTTVERKNI